MHHAAGTPASGVRAWNLRRDVDKDWTIEAVPDFRDLESISNRSRIDLESISNREGSAMRHGSSILRWVLVALAVMGCAGVLLTGCDRTISDDTSQLPEWIR